jgi:isoleucyl-tRNA synthetase
MPFIINDLSAFYLDYTKDILYIEAKDDFERRAVQSTLYDITLGLLKLLTPIIPHTTSEAYLTLPHRKYDDVYLEYMPRKTEMTDVKLLDAFDIFSEVRDAVFKQLEIAREEKVIGKSLQAKVNLTVTEKQKEAIDYLDMKIHQVLIVSKVDLTIGKTLSVEVELMEGSTCERCWNVFDHIHEDGLCDRCHHVLKEK